MSFHATTDEVRDKPRPDQQALEYRRALLDLPRGSYPKVSNSERITFEYVMLHGVNDSDEDAHRLIGEIDCHGIPGQNQPDPVQRMARRAV